MGTTVHCKSYLPGYYSMKDLNEDSNSSGWPLFYGDKTSTNGQYYNDFLLQTVADAYPGYDKDALKQIMLEHEAVFKNQVSELHRLYRIQRDMMDEVKKSVLHKQRIPIESSSTSIPLTSQMPSEDARKWQIPIFPLANSGSAKPSISGAENVNSPLSCTKVNKIRAGSSPLQNGCSTNDYEVLESRPSKVRKKLFDLQLPADEYIDTEEGEQSHDNKMPDIPSYLPNGNHKVAPESGVKLFLGGGVKIDCQEDASRSGSCLRSSIRLADLNAPIQVEEETAPASVDFDFLGRTPSHGEIKGPDLSVKSESQFIGLPKKMLQNSQYGCSNGTLNNICVENKGNGRECLPYMYEAGHSKSNLNSFSQGLQPDKLPLPSQPRHIMPNNAHQSRGILPANHNKGDLWREGTFIDLEISERSHDTSNFNHVERVVSSHIPSPYQLVNSSDLANAWSQSVPYWGKPSSSLTQKLTSVQTHPSLSSSVTLRSTLSSTESHEIFGNKWLLNGSSRSNHGFRSNIPNQGEIYYGSSSVSKEVPARIPSGGFDYLNCNKDDNGASERSIYGSGNYFKGLSVVDLKSAKDVNLNMVFSKSSSIEVVPQQDLETIDGERKHWDHPAALPWLRAKPACKNEVINVRGGSNTVEPSFFQASNHFSNKSETNRCLNQNSTQNITSASCDSDVGAKKNEIGDCQGSRKILGFPIFENPCTSRNEPSSPVSTFASLRCHPQGEEINHRGKRVVIDINVACDAAVPESGKHIAAEVLVEEKKIDIEVASCRNHIDLNLSVSEDEVLLAPPITSTGANVKIAVGIDLEAPVVPEIEEDLHEEERKQHETPLQSPHDKAEKTQDEVLRIAAEAIVAISSSDHHDHMEDATCHPTEASLVDSLLWFVEVISSCGDDLESKLGTKSRGKNGGDNEESSSHEIDYFEAMTLNLTEVKEEEYMPKPLVPDNREMEETGAVSVNRSQKGPGRRGRQRRDFRKDILPGLASLSRHEVTEDLQTFGGLMRATGHPWNLGLTRRNSSRNGGARGRRRPLADPDLSPAVAENTICTLLMQQLKNIEVRPEDTSLTGWGKTTRRPRRQRCPAGNPPSVPLT